MGKADRFTLCCDKNPKLKICDTPHDTFSSCLDLIQYPALRYIVWILAVVILCANTAAFVLRCTNTTNMWKPSSLLALNLCLADGLFSVVVVGAGVG